MLAIESYDLPVQKEFPTLQQSAIIAEGLRRYARDLQVVEQGHLTQEQVEEACAQYGGSIGSYPAFPDTLAAMQRLGKHFKLVPLSNIDHQSFDKARETALKGLQFDAVYTAEDIGSYKPDLRNFRYLLEHVKEDFGVEKDALVHMAQSLLHDHRSAKEVGIQAVWVDRKGFMGGEATGGQAEYGYKLKVKSIEELADVVDRAFAEAQ